MPKGDRLAYKTINDFSKQMATKGYSTILVSVAGKGKIQALRVGFHLNQVLTYESARTKAFEALNEFIALINEQTCLKEYLSDFPVTEKNVTVMIGGDPSKDNNPLCIQSIHIGEGFICFYSGHMDAPLYGLLRKERLSDGSLVDLSKRKETPVKCLFLDHKTGKTTEINPSDLSPKQ